jgi:GAF domain-containing protein
VEPFTDRQIELVSTFADQAVIAIENTRLITEQREALEQQTATTEVLQVINTSPGDLGPVFDAMLEKAMRLCDAAFGSLYTYDGERFHSAAQRGVPPAYAAYRAENPPLPTAGGGPATLITTRRPLHVIDMRTHENYRHSISGVRAMVELGGVRTILTVPLIKDDLFLGMVTVYRQEVRAFSDRQISLLENFAAQAVIAMENARLLTEQREALEQQTATAEVLQEINASPGNVVPVFEAILEKAHTLCSADHGALVAYDGEQFRTVALRAMPEPLATLLRQPFRPYAGGDQENLLRSKCPVHVADITMRKPTTPIQQAAHEAGIRTLLMVPLCKDEALIGYITAHRREVRPFSDREVALLQNFAAQAVIAMENARLIAETREALEQQTATTEVLQVINSSPGDLAPVFDAMLDKAMRLCGAKFGSLYTYDGELFHAEAHCGVPAALAEFRARHPPSGRPGGSAVPLIETKRPVHILDMMEQEFYRAGNEINRATVDLGGARTTLTVPLIKDEALLGAITIYRQEVQAFSEKQIALLQNFAAQAVIAMENARLLTEQREALDHQTATAEVLQVINSSPANLVPVFEAMLDKALNLCNSAYGSLNLYDGGYFHTVAVRGVPAVTEYMQNRGPSRPTDRTSMHRISLGENLVHILDATADEAYDKGDATRRALVDLGGLRTLISVALRKDETLLGAISVYRQEVRAFSDKEIALLQNFAAQAVIATENARLLTEQREALEQQTATAEVLQVINSSPGDLAPVFDAVLEKAMRLCGATMGGIYSYDGRWFNPVALRGVTPAFAAFSAEHSVPSGPNSAPTLILKTKRPVQKPDLGEVLPYDKGMVHLGGIRALLDVPLLKEGAVLGFIAIYREEAGAFSDKEIALLENFAAQAVIAMENARLLNEIRQRQAELRTTFDNMGDGVAMFDAEHRLAAWNRNFQRIIALPDILLTERPSYPDYLRMLTERGEFGPSGIEAELSRHIDDTDRELRLERVRPDGQVIEVRRNAVPGGGFVLIYSDITERKRSEGEIRAARDAAEAAYRDLKAAQASLIQAEKMASLGQLTAGIAHEIKNPLNFVNNFAELSGDLLDELRDAVAGNQQGEIDELTATLKSNLDKINEHGRRADGIVRSMLEHSRGSSGERRSVDLNALVDEALNLAYHGARAQDQSFNVELQRDLGEGIAPMTLAPQDITRVLLNLFSNGFYAARRHQSIEVGAGFEPTLRVTTRELGDAVEIRVRDNGIGIPVEIRDKLFQPFFTTKPTGEGTGLGLSISYDFITQQHGGSITVASEPGSFTEFTVRLPRQ